MYIVLFIIQKSIRTLYLMAKNDIETRLKGNDIASVIKFFLRKQIGLN